MNWASAQEAVKICHGYGCLLEADIQYSNYRLERVKRILAAAVDPESEREKISRVIGLMYRWAGQQSDIKNDRGGNFADDNVPGMMDCIDHATSTTRLLSLLEQKGYLHWHRVVPPVMRRWALIFGEHYSAAIEEMSGGEDAPRRFVVDSWFVDNGKPAVILPLEEWKNGSGPDV